MAAAQTTVNAVEANSVESLNRSIAAIQVAEAACRRAGREGEAKELTLAKDRLEGHLALLQERAERKQREAVDPAQLEKLVRHGDPNCPKGQGYVHKPSSKEIKCVGPQLVEMNWEQVTRHFRARNFRALANESPSTLAFESGAERYVFRYSEKSSSNPPRCVIIYAKPGVSWQEAVARNTGVPPEKLKDGGAISVAQGRLPLSVDEKNQVARIGECAP